jgi:hypothetical protein
MMSADQKVTQRIQITTVLGSGSAFALTTDGALQDAVFIPGAVAKRLVLTEGQVIEAVLIPNARHENSAQWLATQLRMPDLVPPQGLVMRAVGVVRAVLQPGGVWCAEDVFDNATTHMAAYPTTSEGLAAMREALEYVYKAGEVVRVSVEHSGSSDVARWYTRTPEVALTALGNCS